MGHTQPLSIKQGLRSDFLHPLQVSILFVLKVLLLVSIPKFNRCYISQMTHTGGVWLPQLGYNKQWWNLHHTQFPTYIISVTYSTTKIQNFVFYSCEKPLTWGDQLPLLQLGHVGQCRCPQLVFPTFSHELSSLLFVTLLLLLFSSLTVVEFLQYPSPVATPTHLWEVSGPSCSWGTWGWCMCPQIFAINLAYYQ